MAIEAIAWVFKQEIRPASTKFVLVAIADCANNQGEAYPSEKHLRAVTSLDRKTILAAISDLQTRGWLVDTGKREGRTKQVRVFRMSAPKGKGAENGTVNGAETVPFFPSNGPVFPTKRSQKRDTEPSGTVKEPLRTTKEEWKRRLNGFDPKRPRQTWHPFWGATPDGNGGHFGVPGDILDAWRAERGLRPVAR